jgi:hypothetical protein
MNKINIKDKNILAFFNTEATPNFWDEHWEIDNLRKYILVSCHMYYDAR